MAAAAFFASGFAALLDQVVWQRLLGLFSGADLVSATIVVAAFMAGLGAGSLAGGHLADGVDRSTALLLFAGAEIAIGLFGLASKTLYYDVLYARLGSAQLSSGLEALLLFAALLPPTFAMGLSLPLLSKALAPDVSSSAPTIGVLYGINTLGAGLGAAVTTWVLLRRLGLAGSLVVGAAVNGLCALAAVSLWFRSRRADEPRTPATAVSEPGAPRSFPGGPGRARSLPFATWVVLYGLSGFVALSLEIVWFRLLGIMAKSTAFTFGTLLAIYLIGLGVGVLLGTRAVRASRSPASTFLTLQALAAVCAGIAVAAFTAFVGDRFASSLWIYFSSPEPLDLKRALADLASTLGTRAGASTLAKVFLYSHVVGPAVLIGPAVVLMGASFPFLQKAVQTDLALLGRRVGWLQAANIAGSLVGAVLTGVFFLRVFGSPVTLKLLVAASAVFVLVAFRARPAGRSASGGAGILAAVLALTVLLMPGAARLWAKLHGTQAEKILFAEDGSGLSLFTPLSEDPGTPAVLFGNGLSQSWIPYGSGHSLLGAIPAMVHPAPREIAVIGLGSGDTLFHLAGRRETRRLTCVEIITSQKAVLVAFASRRSDEALRAILSDRRIDFIEGDGREYLRRSRRRFDVIEADALRPGSALSGNLYSVEYFELMRRHLKPGGLAVTWGATARVLKTFLRVFPHVVWIGDILIGSDTAIPFDASVIRARLNDPFSRTHYAKSKGDLARSVGEYLAAHPAAVFGPNHDRSTIRDVNTDLFPKDEFHVPQE